MSITNENPNPFQSITSRGRSRLRCSTGGTGRGGHGSWTYDSDLLDHILGYLNNTYGVAPGDVISAP